MYVFCRIVNILNTLCKSTLTFYIFTLSYASYASVRDFLNRCRYDISPCRIFRIGLANVKFAHLLYIGSAYFRRMWEFRCVFFDCRACGLYFLSRVGQPYTAGLFLES